MDILLRNKETQNKTSNVKRLSIDLTINLLFVNTIDSDFMHFICKHISQSHAKQTKITINTYQLFFLDNQLFMKFMLVLDLIDCFTSHIFLRQFLIVITNKSLSDSKNVFLNACNYAHLSVKIITLSLSFFCR